MSFKKDINKLERVSRRATSLTGINAVILSTQMQVTKFVRFCVGLERYQKRHPISNNIGL